MSSSTMSSTMFNIKDIGRDSWTSVMDILALFQELGSPAGKEAVGVFMERYSNFLTEVDQEVAALNTKLAQIPILEAALKEANDRKDHGNSASAEENANIEDLQKKIQDLETALSDQAREMAEITAASKRMLAAEDVDHKASTVALPSEKVEKSEE
ncbi:hypothetical protein NW752_010165 [Fusarium irregulare]|uniref:Uncharacterized protein n=1 Tax=Fusarium irregulare TaxID=2494466 RepID=A0A9W8PK85_9HYPO|nr:hypothetical protein NW752_010165 [Fusarium irregulare]KAJ4007808.1 hypothetical protein NW766_009613 [Fusarium irregulare]